MNNLQIVKSAQFGEVQCDVYSDNQDMFMTSEQPGKCLQYASPRESINKIVSRNGYLKSEEFSSEVILTSEAGQRKTRVFTEDGIYEVTFLAKTEKAKEFRAWVRKLLKSLRKGETVNIATDRLKEIELQAKRDRATAMLLNAQNRMIKTLLSNTKDKNLSQIAIDVMGIKAVEQITGKNMNQYLPECEKLYSATEVGGMFGVSAMKIGKTANASGLKNDTYGKMVMSKSKHSSKEVQQFLYNEKGVQALGKILGKTVKTA